MVAASKAMRNGDWKKARDYIINDKMNAKVISNTVLCIQIPGLPEPPFLAGSGAVFLVRLLLLLLLTGL